MIADRKKCVYFIKPVGMAGPIKIGCTQWPKDRLANLSNWSPFPLEIMAFGVGPHMLERAIHKLFSAHRLHKEWFSAAPELLAGIALVADGVPVADAFGLTLDPRKSPYGPFVRYMPLPTPPTNPQGRA